MKQLLTLLVLAVLLVPNVSHAATVDELRAAIISTLEQLIAQIEDQIETMLAEDNDDADEDEDEEEEEQDEEDDDSETLTVNTSADVIANDSGDTVKAVFEVEFKLRASGDTMYIPALPELNATNEGVTYRIEDETGQEIGAVTNSNIDSAIFTSTGRRVDDGMGNDYYRIDSGKTETFTLSVQMQSNGGAVTGPVRLQVESIRFTGDFDESLKTLPARPYDRFETDFVTLSA